MKFVRNILFVSFICFVSTFLQASRIYQRSLSDFVKEFPQSSYVQCTSNYSFNHAPFPLYQDHVNYFPSQGEHVDMFILEVPQGTALFDKTGYVYVNDSFVKETQMGGLNFFNNQDFIDQEAPSNILKVSGRVAIVSRLYPYCYGLWFFEILSQLALLEVYGVEYDYLCIPYYEKFMQESLDLWGIDRSKIIPMVTTGCIHADVIIMPTSVSGCKVPPSWLVNHYVDFLMKHIHNKILAGVEALKLDTERSEKIFISRKDAGGKRAIPNEDEVFALFEPLGFKRYELARLSVAEKISLFNNAKTIVSFLGSGSTNIMFCKPGTHYIEITQKMVEATFFYVGEIFGLKYSAIDDSPGLEVHHGPWTAPVPLSLEKVKEFLVQNPEL
ncbi:MAG: glycosyltransferase family 61 protein [Candidatus Dependentiae bacterium]|nr:glycosyltransferase family 61 protein [Candidatus Dependentiae bacterium]